MRALPVYMGLLLVVVVSIIGCTTVTYVPSSRQISMVAAIESNGAQQTMQLTQEGLVSASAGQSSAVAEFAPRWDLYRIRMALLLEPGKSDGEAICELEDTYRAGDDGVYALHLDGVMESGPISVDTIESGLEISIEVRSGVGNSVVERLNKKIHPRVFTADGNQRLWLSPLEELDPLKIIMETGVQYVVQTRLALSASSESKVSNSLTSIYGEFRLIVEPIYQIQTREERVKSLEHKLIELWTREDVKMAEDPQLQDAAHTLSRLFIGEAVRYVDIHVPQHNRFACFEHARIVREWYETRMRLDPNLARWFRMTTIRRSTLFLWQSSNLITPNVSDPPDRWLDDGTGIVLEPKYGATGDFYGRYITAKEFSLMGLRPKIQQTARIPIVGQ